MLESPTPISLSTVWNRALRHPSRNDPPILSAFIHVLSAFISVPGFLLRFFGWPNPRDDINADAARATRWGSRIRFPKPRTRRARTEPWCGGSRRGRRAWYSAAAERDRWPKAERP